MDAACERLLRAGRPDGLIACTDADSRPAPDWLERQLEHVAAGARAIAGLIELDPDEAAQLPPGVLAPPCTRRATIRLRRVRAVDHSAGHHHAAGASLAVTAATYRRVGGIEPLRALEDAEFAERLARHRDSAAAAGRRPRAHLGPADGRVARGLSVDLAVAELARAPPLPRR